jgi:Na+-driven multidrug efflux pump
LFATQLGSIPYFNQESPKIINIAMTVSDNIINIIIAFSLLIAIGASSKFSIAYGATKQKKMRKYLGNGITLTIIFSLILVTLILFNIENLIRFQINSDINNNLIKDNIVSDEIKRQSRIFVTTLL